MDRYRDRDRWMRPGRPSARWGQAEWYGRGPGRGGGYHREYGAARPGFARDYDRDYRGGYGYDYRAGPVGPWGRELPWDPRYGMRRGARAFDAAAPEGYDREYDHPRRRREDWLDEEDPGEAGWRSRWRRMQEHERVRGWSDRGREFFGRFKEPIIGLTVAGAALPLAQQAREAEQRRLRERDLRAEQQARMAFARPQGMSMEDAAGERWAEAEAVNVRAQTIEGAMVRYGIDRRLAESIYDAAEAEGIEPDMAFGLVNTESTFRNRAVSHVGARGLTQLLPSTANWIEPGTRADDLFRPDVNLKVGFKYLRYLLDKYDGNERLALLAYNRGPGTVDKVLKRGGNPDNGYADKVLDG